MRSPPTPITSKDVTAFLNSCVLTRSSYEHHKILFDAGSKRRSLLEEISPIFFGDLHALLRDSIYLGICKLTDPEETRGRDNLTVKFLVKNSDFSIAPQDFAAIPALSEQIHKFREKIVAARNRRIGHLDRTAAIGDGPLGAAQRPEWEKFWVDLGKFLSIFYRRYVDPAGVFELNHMGLTSDCDSLVKALKESTYFHEIIRDHSLTQRCADIAVASKYADV